VEGEHQQQVQKLAEQIALVVTNATT
jgi:hypothetical protein